MEVLHFRYSLPRPVPTAMGPLQNRPALLLRLEDSEGAVGWGEIWCNFPPDGDLHRARLARNVLGAALAGVGSDTAELFKLVRQRLHRLALQAGEPGPVSQIAAGIDIALHDLQARRAEIALGEFLGGTACATAVPAYASGISPDVCAEQIEAMRALGYRKFKLRVGFGPDDSLRVAEQAAASLATGEVLMLDANQSWDLATARAQCERLAPLELGWMEEPLPADCPDSDWASLAEVAPMPLAAGENISTQAGFDAAIAQAALKILQPDMCKWGGLSGVFSVARAAEAAGITYCPHFLGGGIGLVASAHLLAAVGGAGLLEVDSSDNPLLAIFSGTGSALDDGYFRLPPGPGLGFAPDLKAAEHMLVSRAEVRL